jgi:hypothetical protein
MVLRLSGTQMQTFVEALSDAFTMPRLRQMLKFRLDKDLDEISLAGDKVSVIFELVDAAQKEGWTTRLLTAARASRPDNPKILAFEASLGLDPVPAADRPRLEKIVRERSRFGNYASFRERSARLGACVCAVELPNGWGTGFLVGPDLVLTNYHVVIKALTGEVSPKDIRCRFDYLALPNGSTIQAGRVVPLAEAWQLAHRPFSPADLVATGGVWQPQELDYALLRLAEKIAEQPLGEKPAGQQVEPGAALRGWITLPSAPPSAAKDDHLVIIQHPVDLSALPAEVRPLPMQIASGEVLGFVGDGIRMRHATRTLPGSSGSPCCNAHLELVALHHAGDPRDWPDYKGEYNQAIPIGLIVADLKARGVEPIWDRLPATSADE